MYDFFFSYSRDANQEIVETLLDSLEEYGFKIWYDKVDVVLGKEIFLELNKTLFNCKKWNGIILFLDNTYFKKEWCLKELDYSIANELALYPILLDITKKDIPKKYDFLKNLNLCTIRSKEDIAYAINKVLFLFLISLNYTEEKVLKLSDYSTLEQLILSFHSKNQQRSDIILICDNIVLCLKYLLVWKKVIINNNAKILSNIVHIITKKYYVSGSISRYELRIAVKATKLLIEIYCK